jgi:ketosteroid isomerase-like protein
MFGYLGNGGDAAVVDSLAEDVHHVFPGDHPLGGERHTRAGVRLWFDRLARLYPGHRFDVDRVVAKGGPWDTWVFVKWKAHLTPQRGEPYVNQGSHWIRLRWGKVTYFHAYLDTDLIVRSCREMADAGVGEATSTPIVD